MMGLRENCRLWLDRTSYSGGGGGGGRHISSNTNTCEPHPLEGVFRLSEVAAVGSKGLSILFKFRGGGGLQKLENAHT